MSLRNLQIKPLYNSLRDNIIGDFYTPVLSEATLYRRASAYFDSNILALYSTGIENLVKNNGRIQFVFSCDLTEHDFELMKQGYDLRAQIENKLLRKIDCPNPGNEIKNLAYLIGLGYVDIKIAFTSSGIFHDKFGLVYDEEESCICFRGSNNETAASAESNSESFDTTCSWNASERDMSKITMTEDQFSQLWNNTFPKTLVLSLPTIIREKIISFGDGKLHVRNTAAKINCLFLSLSESEEFLIDNNLYEPGKLFESAFYKARIQPYVTSISDRTIRFKKGISLTQIKYLIDCVAQLAAVMRFEYVVGPKLEDYFRAYELRMENLKALGIAIKRHSDFLYEQFNEFASTTNSLITRPLVLPQLWGSYQIVKMKRAANFSVPGAGKTAIVLGAFAYLRNAGLVDKIVMVGPLNSFISWKNEFVNVFGDKLELRAFDYQKDKNTAASRRRLDSIINAAEYCNLCLFNYESLPNTKQTLSRLINGRTLLVFDEVHRIKSVGGIRAGAALSIAGAFGAQYRVVLTGTPIPNGFKDSFNFLNILFAQEYNNFFELTPRDLSVCDHNLYLQRSFNDKIYPFFSVIDKNQLNVPPPDPDDYETGYCLAGEKEERLFGIVRLRTYGNTLLTYIRLMQASSNPGLILKSAESAMRELFTDQSDIDYDDGSAPSDYSSDVAGMTESYSEEEKAFISSFGMADKFYKGIQIVVSEVRQGHKVLCWALFIDTLTKIKDALAKQGVSSEIICGTVPLEERDHIINKFQNGQLDVLIANPATLAESVSLHKNCHTAVYFEYSFNLVHLLQSKDRIHRFGLPEGTKTHYYFMIEDNPNAEHQCIDKLILDRLNTKASRQSEFLSNEIISYDDADLLTDIGDLLKA